MQNTESIYSPPKSHIQDLTLESSENTLNSADKSRRLTNFLIDTVAYYALVFALSFLLGVLSYVGQIDLISFLNNQAGGLLFAVVIMLLYYVPMEYYTGRTLGKLMTGTYVVSMDGAKPSFNQILLRSLTRLVPFELFSFLGKNNGWHDKWTNTQVCYKKK